MKMHRPRAHVARARTALRRTSPHAPGRHRPAAFIAGLLALSMAFLCPMPCDAGEVATIDGVPHVQNPATPSGGRQDLHPREIWRVGGDDEDLLLGAVNGGLIDEQGNVYLLDGQLNEVSVISPEGELLRTLSRTGEGPGEIQGLTYGFFLPDGNLAMLQSFPGKIVTIARDGTPVGSLQFEPQGGQGANFGVMVAGAAHGDRMLLAGILMAFENNVSTQTYYMSFCDLQGVEQHRCYTKSSPIDYTDFIGDEMALDFAWSRWAMGPEGHLYVAPDRYAYRIEVQTPDSDLVRVIERDYGTYTRTEEEKALARRYIEAVYNNYPVPPHTLKIEDREADILGLYVTDDGELWVSSSRGTRDLPEGVAILYDVFDKQGHYVRQAALHGDFDPDRDLIRILSKDRLLVVVGAGEGWLNQMGVGEEESGDTSPAADVPPVEAVLYAMD